MPQISLLAELIHLKHTLEGEINLILKWKWSEGERNFILKWKWSELC